MIARTLQVQVPPERVDAVLEAYHEDVRPIHVRADALQQHYVLVDRDAGHIEFIGIWTSAEGLAAVAPELEPARRRLWDRLGGDPEVETFEVADQLR